MNASSCRPLRRTAILLTALAALLLLSRPAPAVEPGLRIGYGQGPDADEASTSVGAFLRFDVPGPVNLELSADYWKEEAAGGSVEIENLPLQATALLYPLPTPVVKPYLLGGVGLFFTRRETDTLSGERREEESRLFSVHAGAGLELSLAGIVHLSAEGRYIAAEDADPTYQPGGWRLNAALSLSF